MAVNAGNIDVVFSSDISQHPHCSHGPTLLFERYDKAKGGSRQFYACSAFRDRKACSFFQWADDTDTKASDCVVRETGLTYAERRIIYHKFRKLPQSERAVCCTCSLLLLGADQWKGHESQGHEVKKKIGLKLLRRPSQLFSPMENNKTFAQYLFSSNSVEFVLQTLTDLNFTHVLCLGCPRLHEAIQSNQKSGNPSLHSMLLDLDDRFGQVYPASKFAKYNMFNHHFFTEDGQRNVTHFLSDGQRGCVLVTDPPFGGMVDALSKALMKLSDIWVSTLEQTHEESSPEVLRMVWFFPYFMEQRIISQLPHMAMLDYKVDYENHALYNNQVKQKGSPVRIFTNISPAEFKLPTQEGYWYCEQCERYSSKENQHCPDCKGCTSKDGTTYVHCGSCFRCVKSSRVHCYTCETCQPKDHVCATSKGRGCHICGDLGHKRRDCPKKGEKNIHNNNNKRSKKRKFEEKIQTFPKKQKMWKK